MQKEDGYFIHYLFTATVFFVMLYEGSWIIFDARTTTALGRLPADLFMQHCLIHDLESSSLYDS